ncbi:uncharacterized protein [Euphorbia lathyris]|uniref:uncharacterized protein n=1 Tax=Euphorbia lathyris TaxID=212925 RepID=UPI00331411D4
MDEPVGHAALFSLAAPRKTTLKPDITASFVNALKSGSDTTETIHPSPSAPVIQDFGGFKAIKISQQLYDNRVEACKHSVIGRITLAKGDLPWKHPDLKLKLNTIWGMNMKWKLISLGKGFFHIILNTADDLNSVWSKGALALKPGILRLSPWQPGFDPVNHRSTSVQIWVRLYNLPWEFWDKQIIADIARVIGVPLRFDKNTIDGEFGHFARILIELDLSKPLQKEIRVDTDNLIVWAQVFYENLPGFYSECNSVGHVMTNCRRVSDKGKPDRKAPIDEGKVIAPQETRKEPPRRQIWQRIEGAEGSKNPALDKEPQALNHQLMPPLSLSKEGELSSPLVDPNNPPRVDPTLQQTIDNDSSDCDETEAEYEGTMGTAIANDG